MLLAFRREFKGTVGVALLNYGAHSHRHVFYDRGDRAH
jgi:hypothetical protein